MDEAFGGGGVGDVGKERERKRERMKEAMIPLMQAVRLKGLAGGKRRVVPSVADEKLAGRINRLLDSGAGGRIAGGVEVACLPGGVVAVRGTRAEGEGWQTEVPDLTVVDTGPRQPRTLACLFANRQ